MRRGRRQQIKFRRRLIPANEGCPGYQYAPFRIGGYQCWGPTLILDRWANDQFELLTSTHILDWVARALHKPCWQQRQDVGELGIRLADLSQIVEQVYPVDDVHGVAEDDEDDMILATAVAANADYLVTGDKGLVELTVFRGIRIVSPRAFLDMLDSERPNVGEA